MNTAKQITAMTDNEILSILNQLNNEDCSVEAYKQELLDELIKREHQEK